MHDVRITGNRRVSTHSFILSFRRFFTFLPGQVINIYFGPRQTQRIYSICSGKDEEETSVLYKVKPEGEVTPALSLLKPGYKLLVSEPYGSFTGFSKNGVFIATGTGIAPFASVLFSGEWKGQTLIHGSRSPDEFYFKNDFSMLNEKYIRCSPPGNEAGAYQGRVTGYVEKELSVDKNRMYYLCGNAEMVSDVRDILISRGVPFINIFAEIYF